jgi:uncharacterized protein
LHILHDLALIGWEHLLLIAVLALLAGFIDAVVGGGGLIQVPALLVTLPQAPLPALFGTNKISAMAGTSFAAYQYAKRISFDKTLLTTVAITAAASAYCGAQVVSHTDVHTLKPAILIILIFIAIYTYLKKDLGSVQTQQPEKKNKLIYGTLLGVVIGFYDGFFGPGTGSFLVLGFVVVLGFEFLHASAYAKIINCTTNLGALIVFIGQGHYYLGLAILMAICNVIGNIIGTQMAFQKGNAFIRKIFLFIVTIMIVRYAYDVFENL